MTLTRINLSAGFLIGFYGAGIASAVPPHFEKLKFELIGQHINCTHCHVAEDSAELTAYGRAIGELDLNRSVPQRVRDLERSPKKPGDDVAPTADVDGDGIQNWVEILAGLNPSEKDESGDQTERIISVVSCHLCHTAVNEPGATQAERAPHNQFGAALADQNRGQRDQGRDGRLDILDRLKRVKSRDSDDDSVRNWDEIVLFYSAGDKNDVPSEEDVESIAKERKRRRPSKEGFGRDHPDNENVGSRDKANDRRARQRGGRRR